MSWPTLKGFLFRNTAAYVTDPANSIFVGNTGGTSAGPSYPTNTTIDGDSVTYGYTISGTDNERDRTTSNDARLAGNHGAGNTDVNGLQWRFDLPQYGTYEITLAFGDASFNNRHYWRILDDASVLETNDKTATLQSVNEFWDASGTKHTAANWPTNQVPKQFTFASQILFLEWGGKNASANTDGASGLAYFGIRQISAGGQPAARRPGKSRPVEIGREGINIFRNYARSASGLLLPAWS